MKMSIGMKMLQFKNIVSGEQKGCKSKTGFLTPQTSRTAVGATSTLHAAVASESSLLPPAELLL